jgi:uncharacterized membrane protein
MDITASVIEREALLEQRAAVAARALFGIAAILFGMSLVVWRTFNVWQTDAGITAPVLHDTLLYVTGFAQLAGGLALLKRETAVAGTWLVLGVYVVFTILHLPSVFAHPLVYDNWGGLFEQVALVAGGLLLLQRPASTTIGLAVFRVCVVAFMLYQAFYIPETASLVPKWVPPGQLFWAYATTAAFGLAALALIIRRVDVLAARLLTLMLALFQVLIWIPGLLAKPHSHTVLAANADNLATVAAAWLVAECLSSHYFKSFSQ